jgi:hypothetical protein
VHVCVCGAIESLVFLFYSCFASLLVVLLLFGILSYRSKKVYHDRYSRSNFSKRINRKALYAQSNLKRRHKKIIGGYGVALVVRIDGLFCWC